MALADGVEMGAAVLAERAPRGVEDRAWHAPETAMALQERAVARARQEAEVLRVAPAGDREAGLAGELANALLVQAAEREAQPRQRRGRERQST